MLNGLLFCTRYNAKHSSASGLLKIADANHFYRMGMFCAQKIVSWVKI